MNGSIQLPSLSATDWPRAQALSPSNAISFAEFIALVNPRYQFYRHCQVLIAALQDVADDKCQRLMVFWPPRHSKSETVSRLFPAYYLYRHPERFVGLTSYAADLASTFSRTARDHYLHAGGVLRDDADAVKYWLTTQGGGAWATGVGGPITGKGFHLGIIDDPIKNAEDAASPTIRNKQQDWYGSTWSTRREPDAAEIIVLTRWHEQDLAGYVLDLERDEPEHWHIIRMPALAEQDMPPLPPTCTAALDWRDPGEALCPERYDAEKLQKIATRIGPYYFGALFQQRPAPRSGGAFDRGHFLIIPAMPALVTQRVRLWDIAGAAKGQGDYTVGARWARLADGRFVVEDVVRGQWREAERNTVLRNTILIDQQLGSVPSYIEQGIGLARETVDEMIRFCAGLPVFASPVRGDKVSRADSYIAQAQAGNVLLLQAAWNEAYIDEHLAFPNGRNDDQVDTGSAAIKRLALVTLEAPVAGGSRQAYTSGVR